MQALSLPLEMTRNAPFADCDRVPKEKKNLKLD